MAMTAEEKKAKQKAYYLANRETILARVKVRAIAKAEEIRAYKKEYQVQNRARIKAKKAAAYQANKDVVLAKCATRYAANPDPVKRRSTAYRKRHPEKARAAVQAWCESNPERLRQTKRAFFKRDYAAHPEKYLAMRSARRAREVGTKVEHRIDYRRIRRESQGICGICREPMGDSPIHYDHKIPLAAGGTHTTDNIQVAHAKCNLRKGAKVA